jgi:hypothetical protein
METAKKVKTIDLVVIFRKMKENRKLYYKVLPVVFVLSCLFIVCIPREYATDTTVVPELDNSKAGGTLSSLASSFGLNMDMLQTSDAITPLLYPDLMFDNKFVSELFNIHVRTADGKVNTTFAKYLREYTARPWWASVFGAIMHIFPKKEEPVVTGKSNKFDPYCMSREEDGLANAVRQSVSISVDKKTGVIGITASAQDPLVCKMLADSTRAILLNYITEYRTNKARTDMAYYHSLLTEAKADYERARQLYASYSDANSDVVLTSFRSKQEDLENEMQLKFNVYSTVSAQYQEAQPRVQERTPAFTLLKGAAIPIKPDKPKRMFFVLGMTLLAAFILTLYSVRDYLLKD